eukprot:2591108-Rhodomonas_salina.1
MYALAASCAPDVCAVSAFLHPHRGAAHEVPRTAKCRFLSSSVHSHSLSRTSPFKPLLPKLSPR